ncbi:RNA-binding protein 28 [Anableps anableps]
MHAPTIFVASLPESATNERLEEIFSEIGPVKKCFVVREKGTEKCRGFGFVTYSMEEDAQRALKEIKEYDGKKLSLSAAKKKISEKKKTDKKEVSAPSQDKQETIDSKKRISKQARLVIRNLSFKCTEGDLKEAFEKFGTVVEASIPLKPDGKMRGFAFVQFKNISGATKALQALNLKEIKGRQVAVDWAVPKEKYIAAQQSSKGNKVTEEADAKTGSDSEDEEEEEKKQPTITKKDGLKATAQQVEELQSSDDDNIEDEDDDDDHEETEDDDDDDDDHEETEDDEDEIKEEQEDDGIDSDDYSESEDEVSPAQKQMSKKHLPSDVKEGRTVFIRNLSFDTDEEGLEEVLLQFGEVNYVKIVLHPDTQHSKGIAFAQFKTKEAADSCIAAAQDETENGGIRVDGRKLMIVAAVSREDALKLKVDKKKVETGTRNLYLAREGLIRAGTKAAEGVSEADMAKRARFEEIKRAKLRDISVFVSKNRLCVHNLPKSVDNKKLKALCLKGLKGAKGVRITECRVMYDKKPEKGQVMGQSLGYGFVQFQDHEQALATLRYLNNNPDIFGSHKRPIVEFSLEDSRKLKLKEMRKQRNKDFIQNRPVKGEVKKPQTGSDTKRPKKGGGKGQPSATTEGQKQSFSGFQTKPEVEHVDLQHGKKRKKVLPLPSHHGPKIRMRDKDKQLVPPPKKAKPGSKRNKLQRQQIEKPNQARKQFKNAKKQFKSKDGDRFDSLVEQYKRKLMGSSDKNASIKRSKWFD